MTPAFLSDVPVRPGTVRRPCLKCQKGVRDTALSVTRKPEGAVVWFCHRCGYRGAWHGQGAVQPRSPRVPCLPDQNLNDHANHDRALQAILAGCSPIAADDPAGRYLASRVLPLPENDVAFHRGLRDHTGQLWPCMVAMVTDAITNEPRALHRTFLTNDGRKAPTDRPRSLLRGGTKRGGVVRLFHDAEVTLGLGIAEGIESALSAVAMGFTPVWACVDAGNLAAFPVLVGIEALTVFIDNDPPNPRTGRGAGQTAFAQVAARWRDAGRQVRHMLPPSGDANDFLAGTTWHL